MNNLDEDIKIVEELKDKRWESYTRPSIFQLDFKEKQAISNLIKELETQINNTHILQSQLDIANAEKIEWKKIVEKLACCYLDLAVPSDKDKDWLKPKPKYLIDWARKEVEK